MRSLKYIALSGLAALSLLSETPALYDTNCRRWDFDKGGKTNLEICIEYKNDKIIESVRREFNQEGHIIRTIRDKNGDGHPDFITTTEYANSSLVNYSVDENGDGEIDLTYTPEQGWTKK